MLPLPDEVIDEFLGHGEQVIHSDHPSFRSFVVENMLLFVGFFVVAILFLGITFNGSAMASGVLLLGLAIVLLVLVLRRLGDRYTSYVVTDTRIMQIQGVVSRRAHSIPWVRVTDLTIDQSLMGRLFGYATLHIESANEDSGLRDLDGVSDPMQFNQYVVDMVVAKQGTTQPAVGRGRRARAARHGPRPAPRPHVPAAPRRRPAPTGGTTSPSPTSGPSGSGCPAPAPSAGRPARRRPRRRRVAGRLGPAGIRPALRRRGRARRARRRGHRRPAPAARTTPASTGPTTTSADGYLRHGRPGPTVRRGRGR